MSLSGVVALEEKSSQAYERFQKEQLKKTHFFSQNATDLQRLVRFFYIFYFQL